MASLTAAITLLLGLMGIIPFEDQYKDYLLNEQIVTELGIDASCPSCDPDHLKSQYEKYLADKDGGIIIDNLAGD